MAEFIWLSSTEYPISFHHHRNFDMERLGFPCTSAAAHSTFESYRHLISTSCVSVCGREGFRGLWVTRSPAAANCISASYLHHGELQLDCTRHGGRITEQGNCSCFPGHGFQPEITPSKDANLGMKDTAPKTQSWPWQMTKASIRRSTTRSRRPCNTLFQMEARHEIDADRCNTQCRVRRLLHAQ